MIRLIAICILALTVGFSQNTTRFGDRALPNDNLAYPVLIAFERGTGSGFFLAAGKTIYLVTAKHVLFDEEKQAFRGDSFKVLSYSKDPSDATQCVLVVDMKNAAVKLHPSKDVAVVKIYTVAAANDQALFFAEGVSMLSPTFKGIVSVALNSIKTFDEVLVSNEVMLMGYPVSLGDKRVIQFDPLTPLLRKGIIAGLNRQTRSIIVDCPAYFGNSGGPVLEIDDIPLMGRSFKVIGIVVQYIPYEEKIDTTELKMKMNSGYSVVTPMDSVLELIK